MKTYVINLDKNIDRMAFMDRQLKSIGIPYERVRAIYGQDLTPRERSSTVSPFRFWCAMCRKAWVNEIGCALSHASIYKEMPPNSAVLVLEDDVELASDFKDRIKYVERHIDVTLPQVYLLSSKQTEKRSETPRIQRSRIGYNADGYVITTSAAEAILKANFPMQVPCDHWGRWVRMGIIELYHALPSVVRQKKDDFVTDINHKPMAVSEMSPLRRLTWRMLRTLGKLIDGALQILGC